MKIKWKRYEEHIDPLNEHGQCRVVTKYLMEGSRFVDEMADLNTIVERDGKYYVGKDENCYFDDLEMAKRHQIKIFYDILSKIESEIDLTLYYVARMITL